MSYLKIAGVVLSYWTVSISMVFANKYLVGSKNSEVDLSIFVAWIQCVVTVVTVILVSRSMQLCKPDTSVPACSLKFMLARQMLTLTCLYVGMLTFNNLCLKNVGVAFFQVARSFTLIFTVIFSATILKKPVSARTVGCCLIVISGFFLGVDQEKVAGTLSVRGVCYGVITSLFVSLNGIYTRKVQKEVVEDDNLKLSFYNNLNASLLFIPLTVGTGQFNVAISTSQILDPLFLLFLVATGALGFLIGYVSALQISYTSPVTHHISVNTKAVLQALIAGLYYNESKPWLWWGSNLLVVTGAFCYAMVKMQEEKRRLELEAEERSEQAKV